MKRRCMIAPEKLERMASLARARWANPEKRAAIVLAISNGVRRSHPRPPEVAKRAPEVAGTEFPLSEVESRYAQGWMLDVRAPIKRGAVTVTMLFAGAPQTFAVAAE